MLHCLEWFKTLCTVSAHKKEFLSIVEIENKTFDRCYKLKTSVESVTNKLFVPLVGLHTSNSPRQIDHPKCTILANDTVVLDVISQNWFQESLLEDVICEIFSSGVSESIK